MQRFLSLLLLATFCVSEVRAGEQDETKGRADLDKAYRAWYKGMASTSKEEREKTLRWTLVTKKDVQTLFPKHGDRLWPIWDKANDNHIRNFDIIASESTRHGAIAKIEQTDVRKDKKRAEVYKQVLELLPKDVPVFELVATCERGSIASGAYVLVNDQWRHIRDLENIPQVIEKLK